MKDFFGLVRAKILDFAHNSPKAAVSIAVVLGSCAVVLILVGTGKLDPAVGADYIRQLLGGLK